MYHRILAFDYDGTLAENGVVSPAISLALGHLHRMDYALFLVTGRRYEGITLGPLSGLFDGIVWENGAVVCRTATQEVYLPFGYVDPHLVEILENAHVPIEQGLAIVSSWAEHKEAVWQALNRWGGDATVVHNKGALMILPAGAAKGPGLERLLELCELSPRNLATFGDGENDLSLMEVGELGVTVADGVPRLKAVADLVMDQPGPAGILHALQTYWLSEYTPSVPSRHRRWVMLGTDSDDNPMHIPAANLVGGIMGVFGDSGSGKSWVTGLIAESMHLAGYQLLLIDPEGDFRGLRALPRVVALEGDRRTLPPPAMVGTLLESSGVSVVVDLSHYPADHREAYLIDLLLHIKKLRQRRFRPHWIVLEEAQYFFSEPGGAFHQVLQPMLSDGGWAFVSYRPDLLPDDIASRISTCLLTSMMQPDAVQSITRLCGIPSNLALGEIPTGHVLMCGQQLVCLRSATRRVQHIRHLYKYLDMPLPRHKRFFFRDEKGYNGVEASSLAEFIEKLPALPLSSLVYHQNHGDFAAWARGALGDEALAGHLDKLTRRFLEGEALREALLRRAASRYSEIHAL